MIEREKAINDLLHQPNPFQPPSDHLLPAVPSDSCPTFLRPSSDQFPTSFRPSSEHFLNFFRQSFNHPYEPNLFSPSFASSPSFSTSVQPFFPVQSLPLPSIPSGLCSLSPQATFSPTENAPVASETSRPTSSLSFAPSPSFPTSLQPFFPVQSLPFPSIPSGLCSFPPTPTFSPTQNAPAGSETSRPTSSLSFATAGIISSATTAELCRPTPSSVPTSSTVSNSFGSNQLLSFISISSMALQTSFRAFLELVYGG